VPAADANLEQLIQGSALLLGQTVGELAPKLALRPSRTEPPRRSIVGKGADDMPRAQVLKYGGYQRRTVVGRERCGQQPGRQLPIHGASQRTKPQRALDFEDVFPPSLIAFGVIAEARGVEAELLRNERT
jgi:hypothetical protein